MRQGEVWRVLSPVFVHQDIFHLVFNMIWLAMLGRQMEKRLGGFRYVVFIALVGIVSNTAQYFMSGSNFMGFGVSLRDADVYMGEGKRKPRGRDMISNAPRSC